MDTILSIVTVIVTGGITLYAHYINERQWSRERTDRTKIRISEMAAEYLRSLQKYRNPDSRNKSDRLEVRASQVSWELVVFPWLNDKSREEIRKMREEKLGQGNLTGKDGTGKPNIMLLIDNVIRLTNEAISGVK